VNEYNSFSKTKILAHKVNLDKIVDGNFMPPYCVCTDPSNKCNQNCVYCNSKCFNNNTKNVLMPKGHLLRLADFYKDWNIQSTIIEGGGEPLLNPEVYDFIKKLTKYDIEYGIITNGSMLGLNCNTDLIVNTARFIGISFDSACSETYKKIRGVDNFNIVCDNVEYINKKRIENNSTVDVNLKMLIHEYNYNEIYSFVKLCKELGCSGAHIKPVAFENVKGIQSFDLSLLIEKIKEQLEKTKELEDDNFSVYSIMYKFGDNLETVRKFSDCQCTPIGGVFSADGNFYLCFNMRGENGFVLESHYPDPNNIKRIWGGQHHKKLISQIDTKKCMRCGLTAYNEIIENCIKKDKLFWKFL